MSLIKTLLDASRFIDYDPSNGVITRKGRRRSNGSIDYYGYLIIKIRGKQWKAHRLAWAKHYGVEPKFNIDHIDGNKLNNAISNLRDVTQGINVNNTVRKKNKDTGYIGIHYDKSTKGLLAKYTTRIKGRAFRFRNVQDAVNLRKELGLKI